MSPIVAVTLLVLALPSLAVGQDLQTLGRGDSIAVRAEISAGQIRGRYAGTRDSFLLVETAGGLRRVPLPSVTDLRRANGQRSGRGEAAVVGALAGGLGLQIAKANSALRKDEIGIAALAGATAGVLIASVTRTTRWDRVPLNTVRPHLMSGTRIRVRRHDGSTVDGWLVARTDSGLSVAPGGQPSIHLASSEVARVEWPVGQKRAVARGAALGLLVGGAVGAVAGAAVGSDCHGESWSCFGPGATAAGGGIMGAMAGAVLGAGIGFLSRRTEWEVIPGSAPGPSGVVILPTVSARGVGAVASVEF